MDAASADARQVRAELMELSRKLSATVLKEDPTSRISEIAKDAGYLKEDVQKLREVGCI